MEELKLKYGTNPHQQPARVYTRQSPLPFSVLNGRPGAINLLDALNAWQLVSELRACTGLAAAASFKHVSPAGAAVGLPLDDALRAACGIACDTALSPLAAAYARARGADRLSSYGDFAALSDECDESAAALLLPEVSDGVIAPAYTQAALAILAKKRKGNYTILQINPDYKPPEMESREVFGVVFEQRRNDALPNESLFENIPTKNKSLSEAQKRDLLVAMLTLKYTQSNSVCYVKDGGAIGVGAGQQSRIHCTRLAGDKADLWQLRQHPKTLGLDFLPGVPRPARDNAIDAYIRGEEALLSGGAWQSLFAARPLPFTADEKAAWLARAAGVALASDAFFPFGDNIARARRSGVCCVAQPGGSVRDGDVIAACDEAGIVMAFTGLRLFTH